MKTVVCDIETDGLDNCKHIWCCVCKDIDSKEVTVFRDGDADKAQEFFKGVDKIIGHNFISFDAYWLNHLWNCKIGLSKIIDTLVLSRLANSTRSGHSLRDWGERLKCYKDHHDDWSQWSQEMEDYCIQDVVVTEKVYYQLKKELAGFSKESIELESWSQFILSLQKLHGMKLNTDLAISVKNEMDSQYFKIIEDLKRIFPPRKVIDSVWTAKRDKSGNINAVSQRIIASPLTEHVEGDTYNRMKWVEFNIDSPKEIVERLHDYWTPTIFTDKGQPKVCEANLDTLREDAPEELKLIKTCKVLKSRSTLVQSFLDACDDEGRVHGTVASIGTATHRMSHSKPNTGNIPSRKGALYGPVCREMYTVAEGRKLVGCDAANIQLRGLCHYMQDETLRYNIVHKDMHYFFSQLYGLNPIDKDYDESDPDMKANRAKSKTVTFAIIMGAGVAKIGSILGSYEKGVQAFDNLKKNCLGWNKFQKVIAYQSALGYFKGLDGRKIPLKSKHLAMSTYLQAFEAVCMKWAMVQAYKRIKKAGLDAFQVAIVHDEMQYDCAADCAEQVGIILRQCIRDAGEHFHTFCPLEGEYMIGNNWHETH